MRRHLHVVQGENVRIRQQRCSVTGGMQSHEVHGCYIPSDSAVMAVYLFQGLYKGALHKNVG